MRRRARTWVFAVTLLLTGVAQADVWDVQTQSDNTPASQNELVHGSDQFHDLGTLVGPPAAADQDWYRLSQNPYSSYEAVIDGTSGDLGIPLVVNRTDATGTIVLQPSDPIGLGFSRSLRVVNSTAGVVGTERLVVTSPTCGISCGTDDVYRIRFYETTYAIPRFNNSGTQTTVLVIQNPTNYTIGGTARFWTTTGVLVGSSAFNLGPKNTLVLPTATVAPGASGAITVTHNGRYGDLAGKAVALEPATGFSFDTPMVPRAL